jgi:hypothetical protein
MYVWNFLLFVETYLNVVVRKAKMIAMLYSLSKPMELLYDDFITYKTKTDLLVRYSGQTKSLEVLLNSIFDGSLNRIYIITDGDIIVNLYTYFRAEQSSFYTTDRAEVGYQPVYTYNRSEDVTLLHDFTVFVPDILMPAKETEINAWVNRYTIAGKTHTIQIIE